MPTINKLNRYSSVIPFKHSEVKVKINESNNLNDSFEDTEDGNIATYINANFINVIIRNNCYNKL